MTQTNNPSQQRLGMQEEYFRQKEAELLAKLHAAAQAEKLQGLAQATGIANEEILGILHELGYTRETVSLLHLVPLVQVAWASGSVTPREREMVLRLCQFQGVERDSAAWQQLNQWLDERPADEFFLTTLRLIRHLVDAEETRNERMLQRTNLISYCIRVATTSRSFLGLGSKISPGEEQALNQIVEELTKRNPAAVQRVLDAA